MPMFYSVQNRLFRHEWWCLPLAQCHQSGFDLMNVTHTTWRSLSPWWWPLFILRGDVVSARMRLYISYVGRSIQDTERVPSVLVSELIGATANRTTVCRRPAPSDDSGINLTQAISFEHTMTPFSPAAFTQGDASYVLSYAKEASASIRTWWT